MSNFLRIFPVSKNTFVILFQVSGYPPYTQNSILYGTSFIVIFEGKVLTLNAKIASWLEFLKVMYVFFLFYPMPDPSPPTPRPLHNF